MASETDNNARVRLARLLAEGCHRAPDYSAALELLMGLPAGELRDFAIGALDLMVSNDTNSDVIVRLASDAFDQFPEGFIQLSKNEYNVTTRCQRIRWATLDDEDTVLENSQELSNRQIWFVKSPFEYLYPYPNAIDYR